VPEFRSTEAQALRLGHRARSAPLDDHVDQRLGRRVGVHDFMRDVGAAAAAVAGGEYGEIWKRTMSAPVAGLGFQALPAGGVLAAGLLVAPPFAA
jgi:hypothetical protein